MKKNILILLFAGVFQGAQAMSGARAFAHQVFRSKTALLATGAAVYKYGSHKIDETIQRASSKVILKVVFHLKEKSVPDQSLRSAGTMISYLLKMIVFVLQK